MREMLKFLVHRGPDCEGVWLKDLVCLGHRRLSIIDLSDKARQPMTNRDESVVVVYNGEIYNYRNLRQQLESKGYVFNSRTDTEVLVHGYSYWGQDLLNYVDGFFSFAIWDAAKQKLFCARDFFGKKPFYYTLKNDRFVFASEVEAIRQGLPASPAISEELLGYYLLRGYFPRQSSAYRDIYVLPAGYYLTFDFNKWEIKTGKFFEEKFSIPPNGDRRLEHWQDVLTETQNHFNMAVNKRLESDVPLGSLLSGGVDSSLVTLQASSVLAKPLTTFTVIFKEKQFSEEVYAKAVIEKANVSAHFTAVEEKDFFDILSKLVRVYGEPFADYSAIPTYAMFKALRPYVKVVLTGDGGDEVFGGYKKEILLYLLRRKYWKPSMGYFSALEKAIPAQWRYSTKKWKRLASYGLMSGSFSGEKLFLELSQYGWTEHWRRYALRPGMWKITGEDFPEREIMQEFQNAGNHDLERYLNMSLKRLTQDFLVKVDRASMANSIEVRCPFLDKEMFSWVSSLSAEELLRDNIPKAIPKELLDRRMGNPFSRRRKMGFTPPLSVWFRKRKNFEKIQKLLFDPEGLIMRLFNPKALDNILTQHVNGTLDHTARIWNILFLNEWYTKMVLRKQI